MEYAYSLTGNSVPIMKKYQVAATVSNTGVPLLIPAAGGAGLALSTTTSAANMVGCNLDTATYVTAQQTDGSSAEREVTVIVNPDAVWRIKMSGGATENTALTLLPVTTASSTGLVVTTNSEWSSPTYDEGVTWGYDGANAGSFRKVTSVSSTAGTVTVAFDQDTAVGDNFLRAPYWPVQGTTIQLTTNLYQANAAIAVGTGAAFKPVELDLRDISDSGQTNSYVYAVAGDHVWGPRPT